MKNTELRIGNYVELLGNTTEIECISKLPMRNTMYWLKCKDYIDTKIIHFKPIPLTEEWLLKFGFEYTNECDEIKELVFKISDWLKFYFNNEDNYKSGCLFVGIEETDIGSSNAVFIESVHQLQNLYFALTGKELSLKTEI